MEAPVWERLGCGGRGKNIGDASQGTCGMRRAGEITELASKEEVVMVGLGGLNLTFRILWLSMEDKRRDEDLSNTGSFC